LLSVIMLLLSFVMFFMLLVSFVGKSYDVLAYSFSV
jgi:hypothetical protein